MKMSEIPEPTGAEKVEASSGSSVKLDGAGAATNALAPHTATTSLQGQERLKSAPRDHQQPVAEKETAALPVSASTSPPCRRRKGRPKQAPSASEGMDEEEQKEFYRKRNAMYSRRKYQRKKIEIEVLQSQKEDKITENRLLKREGDRLLRLLQDANKVVALHETHGLHGLDLSRSVLGLASFSSSTINQHQAPTNIVQEQPSALDGLASAAHLQMQLQQQLSASLSRGATMQSRPPMSATSSITSALQPPQQRRQQQQQQQLGLQQGRDLTPLTAANSLEQLLAQVQSEEALHSAVSASILGGLHPMQDRFQNAQMQALLDGRNLGQDVQQGRQAIRTHQPSVATVLHQQQQGGGMGSSNSFATSSLTSRSRQSRHTHSLSTEDILTLLQHGIISADDAAALLELTAAPSEPCIPPPPASRAVSVAPFTANQDPALSAFDSATLLFLLQQQQQQLQPQQQAPAPSASTASTLLNLLYRQNKDG